MRANRVAGTDYPGPSDFFRFYEQFTDRLTAVTSASVVFPNWPPSSISTQSIEADGRAGQGVKGGAIQIGPGYHDARDTAPGRPRVHTHRWRDRAAGCRGQRDARQASVARRIGARAAGARRRTDGRRLDARALANRRRRRCRCPAGIRGPECGGRLCADHARVRGQVRVFLHAQRSAARLDLRRCTPSRPVSTLMRSSICRERWSARTASSRAQPSSRRY